MSVFTPVSQSELKQFLMDYDLGAVTAFVGIRSGIENTNYFLTTMAGDFVLTLFEQHEAEDMPYFLDLMAWLNEHGVPSAHPITDRKGRTLKRLNGRPAAVVQRLPGESRMDPGVQDCATMGAALAGMHLAAREFPELRPNDRGPRWFRETGEQLMSYLSKEDAVLLKSELHFQSLYRFADLPRGVIHADLFRDNALWVGEELSGIIDFYYACNDTLLYDLAVMVNDWCSGEHGVLDLERALAAMRAYHEIRPLIAIERGAWPAMLRAAALRFWLSRLRDLHFPRPAEIVHVKDQEVFNAILEDRIERRHELQRHWI